MNPPLSVLSWILGLADYVYYFLTPRIRKKRKFFHDGYGDAAMLRRLRGYVAVLFTLPFFVGPLCCLCACCLDARGASLDMVLEAHGQDPRHHQQPDTQGLIPGLLNPDSAVPKALHSAVKEISHSVTQPSVRNGAISCTPGSFTSPLVEFLPPESATCSFSVLEPPAGVTIKAVCVMLPATADTGTTIRRNLYADTLANQGVVGILVTAPYYGARRPAGQEAWFLQQVSDAFAQAWAVALEAVALLHWARGRWAVPLAVTGVSYGAAMAALTSKLYPGPLAVVPFMGCSGPGEPFAHGVLRSSVYWQALQRTPGHERDLSEDEEAGHAACAPADALHRFVAFCVHFTSTTAWEEHIPDSMHGAHALVMLQARHDKFVFFADGVKLFNDLKRVASAPGGAVCEVRTQARNGTAAVAAAQDGEGGSGAPLLGGLRMEVAGDAELVEVVGGHVSGFLQCRWLLPWAVVTALARLEAKTLGAA